MVNQNQIEDKYLPLTSCERLVMEVLWASSHNMSLLEILDAVEKRFGKEWKRQTVATFLSHIAVKGLASSYRIGRVFYYKVEVPKKDYINQEAQEIIHDHYSDNVIEFLSAINETRGFTEDEKSSMLHMLNN